MSRPLVVAVGSHHVCLSSTTTRDNYRTQVEVHIVPRLGGVALSDLTAEQVDGLYRQLEKHGKRAGKCRTAGVTCKAHGCAPERHEGLAPKPVRHAHTALRKALQDAVERGSLGRNVADLANPPTQRDARSRRARDKAWTSDVLGAFLARTADDRLGPLWLVASTTGLRRAEPCGLRWSDVDLDADGSPSRRCSHGGPGRPRSVWHVPVTGPTRDSCSPVTTAGATGQAAVVGVHRDGRPSRVRADRPPRAAAFIRDRGTPRRRVARGDDQAAAELVAGAILGPESAGNARLGS